MRLNLRQVDGSVVSVDVEPTSTFFDLKRMIASLASSPARPDELSIVYSGALAPDNAKLTDPEWLVNDSTSLTVVAAGGRIIEGLSSHHAAGADVKPAASGSADESSVKQRLRASVREAGIISELACALAKGASIASSSSASSLPPANELPALDEDRDLVPMDAVAEMDAAIEAVHLALPDGTLLKVALTGGSSSSGGDGTNASASGEGRLSIGDGEGDGDGDSGGAGTSSSTTSAEAAGFSSSDAGRGAGAGAQSSPAVNNGRDDGNGDRLRLKRALSRVKDTDPLRLLRTIASLACGFPLSCTGLVFNYKRVPHSMDRFVAIAQLRGLQADGSSVVSVVWEPSAITGPAWKQLTRRNRQQQRGNANNRNGSAAGALDASASSTSLPSNDGGDGNDNNEGSLATRGDDDSAEHGMGDAGNDDHSGERGADELEQGAREEEAARELEALRAHLLSNRDRRQQRQGTSVSEVNDHSDESALAPRVTATAAAVAAGRDVFGGAGAGSLVGGPAMGLLHSLLIPRPAQLQPTSDNDNDSDAQAATASSSSSSSNAYGSGFPSSSSSHVSSSPPFPSLLAEVLQLSRSLTVVGQTPKPANAHARAGRVHGNCCYCGSAGAHFAATLLCPCCLSSESHLSKGRGAALALASSAVVLTKGGLPPADSDVEANENDATVPYSWGELLSTEVLCTRCGYSGAPELGFACRAVTVGSQYFPSELDVPEETLLSSSSSSSASTIRRCPSGAVAFSALVPAASSPASSPSSTSRAPPAADGSLSLPASCSTAAALAAEGSDSSLPASLPLSACLFTASGASKDEDSASAGENPLKVALTLVAGPASAANSSDGSDPTSAPAIAALLPMDAASRRARLAALVQAILCFPAAGPAPPVAHV